jgi:Tfp pilus assembly protein PilO
MSRLSRIVNMTHLTMSLVGDATAAHPQLEISGVATTFRFVDDGTTSGE